MINPKAVCTCCHLMFAGFLYLKACLCAFVATTMWRIYGQLERSCSTLLILSSWSQQPLDSRECKVATAPWIYLSQLFSLDFSFQVVSMPLWIFYWRFKLEHQKVLFMDCHSHITIIIINRSMSTCLSYPALTLAASQSRQNLLSNTWLNTGWSNRYINIWTNKD